MTVWNVVLLIVGMALLIKGADFFVDGASNIAKALKIPSLIIGLTLVSIGTSLPETSVSITSVIQGLNDISIGNVVGSDIFNILPIIGVSSLIVPMCIDREMKIYHIPIMMGTFLLLILFSYVITPNSIDRWEGIVMVVFFIAYTVFLIIRAKKSNPEMLDGEESEEKKIKPVWLSIILSVVGIAGIVFGGKFVVDNAAIIARACGMSEVLVGLTIVAAGTSLPELVTSIVAAIKKENDIAVGNVVGSNIFNILFIVGLAGTIMPMTLDPETLIDMFVMLGSGLILMLISLFSKKTNRWQGILMLLMYAGYLTYIIIRN